LLRSSTKSVPTRDKFRVVVCVVPSPGPDAPIQCIGLRGSRLHDQHQTNTARHANSNTPCNNHANTEPAPVTSVNQPAELR
jgi:hypothetical protein